MFMWPPCLESLTTCWRTSPGFSLPNSYRVSKGRICWSKPYYCSPTSKPHPTSVDRTVLQPNVNDSLIYTSSKSSLHTLPQGFTSVTFVYTYPNGSLSPIILFSWTFTRDFLRLWLQTPLNFLGRLLRLSLVEVLPPFYLPMLWI